MFVRSRTFHQNWYYVFSLSSLFPELISLHYNGNNSYRFNSQITFSRIMYQNTIKPKLDQVFETYVYEQVGAVHVTANEQKI